MPIKCAITQSDEQRNTQHPPHFFFFVFFKYVMSSDFSDIFFWENLYTTILKSDRATLIKVHAKKIWIFKIWSK